MLKDKLITGAIIGILADFFKLLSNYIMFKIGLTNVVFWQIAATRFLDKEELFKPVVYLVGGTADLTVTAILGVVFVLILYFFSTDYIWLKGIGYALGIWVTLFGTLLTSEVQTKIPLKPSGIIVTIIAHFIYGLGFALFGRLLYHPEEE